MPDAFVHVRGFVGVNSVSPVKNVGNMTLNTTCGTLSEYSTPLFYFFEVSGIEDSTLLSKRPVISLANSVTT